MDKVVGWALSNHLMSTGTEGGLTGEGDEKTIAISPQSIDFALKLLEESKPPQRVRNLPVCLISFSLTRYRSQFWTWRRTTILRSAF